MITDTRLESVGSAAPTTSPFTSNLKGMQVKLHQLTHNTHVTLTWDRFILSANIWKEVGPRKQGSLVSWRFSTNVVPPPSSLLSHELPIFAAFLLECHQRLCKATGARFNPVELER